MGDCSYCGKSAGLFRSKHKECESKHAEGWRSMIRLAQDAVLNGTDVSALDDGLTEVASENHIALDWKREAIVQGWEAAVTHFLEDGELDAQEETSLSSFVETHELTQDELDKRGAYQKTVKATVLRTLMNGEVPQKIMISGSLPFNFQKSETLIWVFTNVAYYRDKTRRHYEGGHHGFSVRVAKGLYYRAGAFRGHPVETTECAHLDTGMMGVTTKHTYFSGANKSFRIRHDKVVSFTPYSDGIGLHRDTATAKPETFVTGDGWFTYNLLRNIARL